MKNAIKVLVVDDDKAGAQMLCEIVKRLGFKPIVAHKSVEALNVVRLQTVHAAIVDVLLPKMTGAELVTEFRKTKFADQPVIFVSGVFKDRTFASETMKKTGAIAFLFKPFEVDELTQHLMQSLQHLTNAEKWSVQSLLTRKLNSDRDRAKAIERLDKIKGLDFPFVLSILMEVGSTGNLNIVSDSGEIFGVSLVRGTIAEVDSSESQSTGVLALISKGFLNQDDWDEYQKSGRRFSLDRLVEQGYVSPHAVSDARREQILFDFQSICSAEALQVNFVPHEENEEPPRHAVKLPDLMTLLCSSLDEFFPFDYLKEFYSSVQSAPIRMTLSEAEIESLLSFDGFGDPKTLKLAVKEGKTLEEALVNDSEAQTKALQALHYLVLNRAVMFDDVNLAKNLNDMLERYKKLYSELQDMTADKIFEYFGVQSNNTAKVQTTYDEYVKSNHPDQLGKDASPELRDLCRKCFDLVTKAKEVLTDETAKTALFSEIKARAAEKQQQSQELMKTGLELLRKGQMKEAFDKLKTAEDLHSNARLNFICAWAEIKAIPQIPKTRLQELAKKIDEATSEERKSPFYFMAMGLIKKGMGDATAIQMFEKAMQVDSEFLEARRELNILQNASNKPAEKKLNIFQDDISSVVSQIFRRKSE